MEGDRGAECNEALSEMTLGHASLYTESILHMTVDGPFDRLDGVARELVEVANVHLVEVETNQEGVIATADVGDVRVTAWYDEDDDLLVAPANDDAFEDAYGDVYDYVLDYVDEVASDDGLRGLLDEAEWLRSRNGDKGLADYRAHLRGDL